MIQFGEMSESIIELMFILIICVFIQGLFNLLRSLQTKQIKYIVISGILFVTEYFLLQIVSDILNRRRGQECVELSERFGHLNVIWWIVGIAVITLISITLSIFFRHWNQEHITAMSVKDSIDMLNAGLCYWEDGGRMILLNKKMDEICLALSGETLMNGDHFYQCIESDCMSLPDGRKFNFFHNTVDFEDKQIHELIAVDVTELYKKNELLEQETIRLQKMNESLRRYNQNIEETVRKQEILDAKVYIHDEMNRLMLITTANIETPMPEEDFNEILTLWKNNSVLMGMGSGKSQVNMDVTEVNRLAKLLGIDVKWRGEQPEIIPDSIRELFVMVAREAIANAVKHGEAGIVTIDIKKENENLIIDISNDGHLPSGSISLGGGLTNIKRMVEDKRGRMWVDIKEQFHMIMKFEVV